MARKAAGRKPAPSKSVRKDGFVFAATGLDALLVDYLYVQVPEGKRRDQMKRLMLLGLMQDLGIKNDQAAFIPPRPIELSTQPLTTTLNDAFLDRSTPAETFNNVSSRLIENDNDDTNIETRRSDKGKSTSSEDRLASSVQFRGDEMHSSPASLNDEADDESSNDMVNGLSVSALMAFKG